MTSRNFSHLRTVSVERRPFLPFTVELVGGRRFEVDHARAIIEREGSAAFMAPGGIPIWFDHDMVVSIVCDTADASV